MPIGEGEKLDPKVVVFRLKVLKRVLQAGDPVTRVDDYRDLFEEGGYALTTSSHMRQLIPLLHQRLLEQDAVILKDKLVTIIFDGTSYMGELLLVIVRYYHDGQFHQRLIRLRHSDVPLNAVSLAFVLHEALTRLGLAGKNVIAFIKDAAEVNFAAVTALKDHPDYGMGRALSLFCYSHMFNRVGKKLQSDFKAADAFIKVWSSYFKKSMKVRCPSLPSIASSMTSSFSVTSRAGTSGATSKWPTARAIRRP
jgi:hypothetical protein